MTNEVMNNLPRSELVRLDEKIQRMIELVDELPTLAMGSDERDANWREYIALHNEVRTILPPMTEPLY